MELAVEFWVVSDDFNDVGAVYRARAPGLADDSSECALYAFFEFLVAVVDHVDGADALAVQSKVLGEGLCDDAFNALAREKPGRVAVILEAAGRKALIGRVEEGDMLLALENLQQFVILLLV